MNIQAPFALASVHPLGVWRFLRLRLHGVCQFQAFLASSPCAASAGSSGFVVRGLCGHFRFCVLGLTRRSSRPAFGGRLTFIVSTTETQLYSIPCLLKRHSVSQALFSAGFAVFPGFACWRFVIFQSFGPPALA